jgi:hypothetical protein
VSTTTTFGGVGVTVAVLAPFPLLELDVPDVLDVLEVLDVLDVLDVLVCVVTGFLTGV